MVFGPGTRLGVYEVTAPLGEGGMGQVWRATDTALGRQVAIKILPDVFASDPERLARFEREAKTLASLNHPHIAAIYGFEKSSGMHALVMELVEGEDLSQRIARGAIPVDEALPIARQIAEALEAAHEQGIIHRDLKPANIRARPDGTVKVLDFGLAKALAPASDNSATVTAIRTQAGVIMGTAPYMSPEQARGEAAGRQTDIWSFGVVLYELLTGRSPFSRPSTAETLASVLGTQPDYSGLPSNTPANARQLIRRCLEKDRKRRSQHMGDVRIEVEEALAALTADPTPGQRVASAPGGGRLRRAAGVIVLTVLAGLVGWVIAQRSATERPAGVVRLAIPSMGAPSTRPYGARNLAISEDGSSLAYASENQLWIRRLGQKEAVAIDVNSSNPFFSANGEWVGFFDETGLKRVPTRGGVLVPVVTTSERPSGGTWRADGTIVFATTGGLYQVSENGGEPRHLAGPDAQRKQRQYAWPQFMPDGQSVLFTIVTEDSIEGAQIAVLDLRTLESRIVLKGGSAARHVSTGHLVYASGPALKAIAFDPETLEASGDPVPLPDIEVATALDNGAAQFAISGTGTLLFMSPIGAGPSLRSLVWVDRQGKEEPLAIGPGAYRDPRVSPDGTRVALDISGANRDIWIWNLRRRSLTKLTDGPTEDLLPVWSPDGSRIFFSSDRTRNFDVYSQAADGATTARLEFAGPGSQMTSTITSDGARLLVVEDFKDISVLDLARPERLSPLLHGDSDEWLSAVSPDGNWIAYESNESGGQVEIFLRPFPAVSTRREKISIDGGRYPLWGPRGSNELFYLDLNGGMRAAVVERSPSLKLGRVTKLFDWEKPQRGISGMVYSISPVDGRFLMTKPAGVKSPGADVTVILNWFEELRRLARK